DELLPRVTACFDGAATATGCTVEIEHVGHTYDELRTHPVLAEIFERNAAELGRTMLRGEALPPSQSGSTDMGHVSQIVPTLHPFIGVDCFPTVNHQQEFADHTITPKGEQAIYDGAVAMAWTIVDLAESRRWDELGAQTSPMA